MSRLSLNYIFLCIVALSAINVQAQEKLVCATVLSQEDMAKIPKLSSRSSARILDAPVPIIAITAHLVRLSDGSGGLSEEQVLEQLETVNDFYRNAGIEFYISTFNIINSSTFFNYNVSEEEALTGPNDIENTINVYFVNEVAFGSGLFGGTACGYAYLPETGPDHMFLDNGCALNGSTFPHEIGHFFNLFHTQGPTNNSSELVNGSNCLTAGDDLCDTPADPTLSESVVNTNCVYVGNARDANNQLYNPLTDNVMSYSRVTCRDAFTDQQYQRVSDTYFQLRSYLLTKPVNAAFEADQNVVCQSASVHYTDLSEGATEWEWSFPGGTPSTSTVQNPVVTYEIPGKFDVALSVSSSENGMNDTETQLSFITVNESPTSPLGIFESSFEEPDALQNRVLNPDEDVTFELSEDAASLGTASVRISIFESSSAGNTDILLSDILEHDQSGEYLLQFDYAYKQRDTKAEKLDVVLEEYCSGVKQVIWSKEGAELAMNQMSSLDFVPLETDWIKEGIFFSTEGLGDLIRLRFELTSDNGNNFYLDNLKIRPRKASDTDSITLLSLYESTNGSLPWDLNSNLDNWTGVHMEVGAVVKLEIADLGLEGFLPADLSELSTLQYLDISGNPDLGFEQVVHLDQLDTLLAARNNLSTVFEDWSGLSELAFLSLQGNQLTTIPSPIFSLPNLQQLDYSRNELSFSGLEQYSIGPTLDYLDLSYNDLQELPSILIPNPLNWVDISNNSLRFNDFLQIQNSSVAFQVYGPQALSGSVTYQELDEGETIVLSCPLPVDIDGESESLIWKRNGQEVADDIADLEISTSGYYTCETTNDNFPDLTLRSRPALIDTSYSVCDQGISGSYVVNTTGISASAEAFEFDVSVELVGVGQHQYEVTDISGGVATGLYGFDEVSGIIRFDCGVLMIPSSENYSYRFLDTDFDHQSGDFQVTWINELGDRGISNFVKTATGLSNQAEILAFSFVSEIGPANIDAFNKEINISVGCKEGSSQPSFTLSDGAQAYVDGELQISGISINDFSQPIEYQVIAEDGVSSTAWTILLMDAPSVVDFEFEYDAKTICIDPNGSAAITSVSVNGENRTVTESDFTMVWSDDEQFSTLLETGDAISGLSEGQYFVRVTEIISGCVGPVKPFEILDQTPVANIQIDVNSQDKSCGGLYTGEVLANISGLPNPYSIEWFQDQEGEWINLEENASGLSGLQAGAYQIKVTDDVTGCEFEQEVTILSQPSVLSASHQISIQTDCQTPNGSIDIIGITQDGIGIGLPTADYEVEWSTSSNFSSVISTGYSLGNLESGTYYYHVTDELLACISPPQAVFVGASTLSEQLIVEAATNNTNCTGIFNGNLSVSVNESIEDYDFEWYNGFTTSGSVIGSAPTLNSIEGGTYTVKVTGSAGPDEGCISTLTTSISNQLPQLSVDLAKTDDTSCIAQNGSVRIDEFYLNGLEAFLGGAYTIEWSENPSFGSILSNQDEVTDLSAGRYYVRVIDEASGCQSPLSSIEVLESYIDISPSISIVNNTHCAEPYTGALSLDDVLPLEEYTIEWYRDNEIIGNHSGILALPSSIYELRVTHLPSGCTFESEYAVLDELPGISVDAVAIANYSCLEGNGGISLTAITEDGIASAFEDYEIVWSSTPDLVDVLSTDPTIDGLRAGSYYVRAMNKASGCGSAVREFVVEDSLEIPEINLENIEQEVPAKGIAGSISISVIYSGEVEVAWTNENGVVVSNSLTADSLAAGIYEVIVIGSTDKGGCTYSQTFEVGSDDRALQEINFSLPGSILVSELPLDLQASSDLGLSVMYEILSGSGNISGTKLASAQPGNLVIRAFNSGSGDVFAAADTASIEIKPLGSVTGTVTTQQGEPLSSGSVLLLDAESRNVVKIANLNAGLFSFTGLLPQDYLLIVRPTSDASQLNLNTYYPQASLIADAEALSVSGETEISIIMNQKAKSGVNEGKISGYIGFADSSQFLIGKSEFQFDPLDLTVVQLVDANDETQIIDASQTGSEGRFVFSEVPAGEYRLRLDLFESGYGLQEVEFSYPDESEELLLTIYINQQDINYKVIDLRDQDEEEIVTSLSRLDQAVKLYPNPVGEQMTVELPTLVSGEIEMQVIDAVGKIKIRKSYSQGGPKHLVDVRNLNPGVYLLIIQGQGFRSVQRFTKQ